MCDCGEKNDVALTLFGSLCWNCRYRLGLTRVCSCGTWFEPHDGLYPQLCGSCAFPKEKQDHEDFDLEREGKLRMELAEEQAEEASYDRHSY